MRLALGEAVSITATFTSRTQAVRISIRGVFSMAVLPSISATPELPIRINGEGPVRQGLNWLLVANSLGASVYIAATAWLLYVDWMVAIPVVLAAAIVVALIANKAVCANLVVDEEPDAIDRMLLENEREYAPVSTGVEAEWAWLTGQARALVRAAVRPAHRRSMSAAERSGTPAKPSH